jgi:hypothetical protein
MSLSFTTQPFPFAYLHTIFLNSKLLLSHHLLKLGILIILSISHHNNNLCLIDWYHTEFSQFNLLCSLYISQILYIQTHFHTGSFLYIFIYNDFAKMFFLSSKLNPAFIKLAFVICNSSICCILSIHNLDLWLLAQLQVHNTFIIVASSL